MGYSSSGGPSLPVSVANGGTGVSAIPRFGVSRGTSNQTGIVSGAVTAVVFNTAIYDVSCLHIKIYQKRPLFGLFNSSNQMNGVPKKSGL